jgi:hypothetical protein
MKKKKQALASTTAACSKGKNLLVTQLTPLRKNKKHQTVPKRGEKDFEPDGTNKQRNLLQEGREAMYTALSYDAGL